MASLQHAQPAVADATGTATAALPYVPFGERWHYTSLTVRTNSGSKSGAVVYRGAVDRNHVLDETALGGNSNTTDTVMDLEPNDRLIVQWTGCDVGSSCVVTATGYSEVRR